MPRRQRPGGKDGRIWGGSAEGLKSRVSPRFAPTKRWHIDTILRVLTTVRQGLDRESWEGVGRVHHPDLATFASSRQAHMYGMMRWPT